jgi:hypothetical protein
MTGSRWRLICNLVLYQASWFACVLGAAQGHAWIGLALTAIAVIVAAGLSGTPRRIVLLALLGVAVGTAVETTMLASGLASYAEPGSAPPLPPLWMIALWVGFAINTHELLGWMMGRPGLQAAFGLIGAPIAYLAGEKLGAMTFLEPRLGGLALIAGLWAVAFPALMALARRIPDR